METVISHQKGRQFERFATFSKYFFCCFLLFIFFVMIVFFGNGSFVLILVKLEILEKHYIQNLSIILLTNINFNLQRW